MVDGKIINVLKDNPATFVSVLVLETSTLFLQKLPSFYVIHVQTIHFLRSVTFVRNLIVAVTRF